MAIKNIGLVYTLILEPNSDLEIDFQAKYDLMFTKIIIVLNVTTLLIYVNDILISNALTLARPIIVNANDNIRLVLTRDYTKLSKFELIGNTLN